MNNIKTSNIPQMSVGTIVSKLSEAYSDIINKGIPINVFPSVMLWGPPGVGKSQAIKQIAREISDSTGKKTVVTDVRLLLFNPIDLRGIPTANEDKTLAIWLKPQIFNMNPSDNVVNILFLDEINCVSETLAPMMLQFLQCKTFGNQALPEG